MHRSSWAALLLLLLPFATSTATAGPTSSETADAVVAAVEAKDQARLAKIATAKEPIAARAKTIPAPR
jgi:hypothetical protein